MYRAVDDFLPEFEQVRFYADIAPYSDITSPVDGVTYPDICLFLPPPIICAVADRLEEVHEAKVAIAHMFLRLSKKGTVAPNQAHNDISMAPKSLMLYMNRAEDIPPGAGTSFLEHKDGDFQAMVADSNVPEAWDVIDLCEMKPNRACLFDAHHFHRAEPIGGFGHTKRNGRLVLTAFYDVY